VTGAANFDLGAIHPKGIHADIEQTLLDMLEVDRTTLGTEGIVNAGFLGNPVKGFEAQAP